MTSPGNHIFDLLYAPATVPSPQQHSESGQWIEDPEAHFSDVLGNLLGLTELSKDGILPQDQEAPLVPDVAGELVGHNPLAMDTLIEGEIPERVTHHAMKVAFADERAMPMANKYVNDMLNGPPLDMAPGKYEIIDSLVADGTLYLKVANKHDKLNAFDISIPISQLRNQIDPKVFQGALQSQAALGPLEFDKAELEDYFAKLNLKEIEVTQGREQKQTRSVSEPIQAILAAHNMGQEVTIRSNLSKNALRMRNEDNSADPRAGRGDVGIVKEVTIGNQPTPIVDASRAFSRVATMAKDSNQFEGVFSLENSQVSNDQNESSVGEERVNAFFGFERTSADGEMEPDKINMRPVRFTLPDNIKSAFKPNVQAVTLRIEPEHLGPARLSLMMHNDKLRARVVVENYAAKVAVEASLDRLVDQLSRANIEIDRVKVTVDGDAARNQLFERRPQWHHRTTQFGRLNLGDPFTPNLHSAVSAPASGSMSYVVEAGGINLLA